MKTNIKGMFTGALMTFAAGLIPLQSVAALLPEKNPPGPAIMRQKLNYAKGALEGITLERFDLVVTNGVLLREMNLTNVFLRIQSPDYLREVHNFQSKVDRLIRAGKEANLEKATKAYSQITLSCVDCHKLYRREQFARQQLLESQAMTKAVQGPPLEITSP